MGVDTKELPESILNEIDELSEALLTEEQKTYNNDLVSFSEFSGKAKEAILAEYKELYARFNHIYEILEERLIKEEALNPDIPEIARYTTFIQAMQEFEKNEDPKKYEAETPQEGHKISPEFMDRVYYHATLLLSEPNYPDAETLFFFLRFFNPNYYEYWLGEATALHEQQKHEDALNSYIAALLRRPDDPLSFLQMACCYLSLENKEAALVCLNACLERIEEIEDKSEEIKSFETEASEIKIALEA